MSQRRSDTATRVRRQAGPSIFGCSLNVLLSPDDRDAMFRKKIGWVERGGGYYDTWAVEVLHKDFNGSFDIDSVFLNPVLLMVSKA
jgi:hypothetical protein